MEVFDLKVNLPNELTDQDESYCYENLFSIAKDVSCSLVVLISSELTASDEREPLEKAVSLEVLVGGVVMSALHERKKEWKQRQVL